MDMDAGAGIDDRPRLPTLNQGLVENVQWKSHQFDGESFEDVLFVVRFMDRRADLGDQLIGRQLGYGAGTDRRGSALRRAPVSWVRSSSGT